MTVSRPGDTLSRSCASDLDRRLADARIGDSRAFEHLFKRISPAVESSLLRLLRSDADAASAALQDAWSAASQRLGEFESGDHLVRWLHRVAKCLAISGLRKKHKTITVPWQERSEDGAGLLLPAAA